MREKCPEVDPAPAPNSLNNRLELLTVICIILVS